MEKPKISTFQKKTSDLSIGPYRVMYNLQEGEREEGNTHTKHKKKENTRNRKRKLCTRGWTFTEVGKGYAHIQKQVDKIACHHEILDLSLTFEAQKILFDQIVLW